MNLIYEILTVFIIYFAGAGLALMIPLPGSLMSMAIFFILLLFRVLKAERYTGISKVILGNLTFFFIPPAVKIIDSMDVLNGNIFKLIFVLVISNLLVMAVAGKVVELFLKKEKDDV